MPEISVIVPAYNAEKYLDACIDSVKKQTFEDWELLLIDDGSRDATGEIGEKWAAADGRIRFFHKENGGVSSARNLGLSQARGRWIAFLDVDDSYEPRCLEVLHGLCIDNRADSAACAHVNLSPDGHTTAEAALAAGVYEHSGIMEGIVYPLLGDRLVPPLFNGFIWRFLYSGDIIRDNKIEFEGAYLEDELFLMEYFCLAKKLAVTEQALYRYLINPASATRRYMADFMSVFGRFMERKEGVAAKYALGSARPMWREHSNWAGLLIAVGNEYAAGNPKTLRERQNTVRSICAMPEMARAIKSVKPCGLSKNKQIVADLIRGRHFFLLTQLYRVKNRI